MRLLFDVFGLQWNFDENNRIQTALTYYFNHLGNCFIQNLPTDYRFYYDDSSELWVVTTKRYSSRDEEKKCQAVKEQNKSFWQNYADDLCDPLSDYTRRVINLDNKPTNDFFYERKFLFFRNENVKKWVYKVFRVAVRKAPFLFS